MARYKSCFHDDLKCADFVEKVFAFICYPRCIERNDIFEAITGMSLFAGVTNVCKNDLWEVSKISLIYRIVWSKLWNDIHMFF